MKKSKIRTYLAGLLVALGLSSAGFAQSPQNRPKDAPESNSPKAQATLTPDQMGARAEDRAESLRDRLFEVTVRELDLMARLDDLDYRTSPEGIQRALAFVGSARPMDELREALRIRLERERARVNSQLEMLASFREQLETAIRETDAELDRLRQRNLTARQSRD
jgi:hypothetical protein